MNQIQRLVGVGGGGHPHLLAVQAIFNRVMDGTIVVDKKNLGAFLGKRLDHDLMRFFLFQLMPNPVEFQRQ